MENTSQNCLFCKIVKGEIPSEKIYEDNETLAFLDIKPINPGHTLVIPKSHFQNTLEVPEDIFMKMIRTVKKISHSFKDGLEIENFNIVMNNGKEAGQVVFHAHIHVIPRKNGDGYKLWSGKDYSEGEMQKIAEKIRLGLAKK